MISLAVRLEDVRARMAAAAHRSGRGAEAVALVAVSKTVEPERIAELAALGARVFGENRVQEAQRKIPEVRALVPQPLEWHCIGSLQRNKAARAAELFDCIESVDRVELAHALERAAAHRPRPLRVLAQVNIDDEPQKGGIRPSELPELVGVLDTCQHLALEGLMAVPRACSRPEEVRPSFAHMRDLLDQLNRGRPSEARLCQLSMGMSSDFEVAIEEGSTLVRVGTAIFGERSRA